MSSHHNGSLDPMHGCEPLTVKFPVSGQQLVLWTIAPGFPGEGLPVTVSAYETSVEDNGLTRTIKFHVDQSPPAFRQEAKKFQRDWDRRTNNVKKRRWAPFLGPEDRRLKELVAVHGEQWTIIANKLADEGFPARTKGTISRRARKLIQEEQGTAASTPPSSTGEDGSVPTSAC